MTGIKNKTICEYLQKWLRNANITQTALSKKLGVSQPMLSRQLKGKDSIPKERIFDIAKLASPSSEDLDNVMFLLEMGKNKNDDCALMHFLLDKIGHDRLLLGLLMYWDLIDKNEKQNILFPLIKNKQNIAIKQNMTSGSIELMDILIEKVKDMPKDLQQSFFHTIVYPNTRSVLFDKFDDLWEEPSFTEEQKQ